MTRGPRPWKALDAAILIAKARGLIQMAMGGPERISDISIVSKIPIIFASVMFAPKILAEVQDLAEYFGKEIVRLRLIARDAAGTAELWLRSKHGSWRFFRVTSDALVDIDRIGERLGIGRTIG